MATTYGLSATGFAIKTLAQIQLELQQAFQAAFGAGIDVTGNSVLGQIIGILGGREADLWELSQAVYLSAFPDTAQGVDLSYAVTLTGQQRLQATASTVVAQLTGTPGTLIPAGFQAAVVGSGAIFVTTTDLTLDSVYGTASTTMIAQQLGPIAAPLGTLTVISTPVSGLASVNNATDASLGRNDETDAQLRSRRAQQLVTAVGGTQTAIQEALLKVPGVSFAAATENSGDVTDANGVPPHSLHVFVLGGLDADVAQAIWIAKPAGANTYGANSATILDTYGNQQTIYWDRGQDVPMYLIVQRTTKPAYPPDGDEQIVAAILAYGATLSTGDTVFNWRLAAALSGIPGIDTLTILQGTAPNPASSANTPIAGNQIATFAAQSIVVG